MLARAVVEIAVALVAGVGIGVVIAAWKLRFDVDVEDVRGSIGRVGWRTGREGMRKMLSMCWRYLWKPWRSK